MSLAHSVIFNCHQTTDFFFCRGVHKEDNKRKGDPRDQAKFSRLIGCPWAAHANYDKQAEQWTFMVDLGKHNHPPSKDPRDHIENHHLTPAQYERVKNMPYSGVKPANMLRLLRTNKEDPSESILATINTIYAAKRRVKHESL